LEREIDRTEEQKMAVDIGSGLIAVGAGLAVGLAGVGAGMGESQIGAAAVGATAEDQKMFGKGIVMTVLPETIVIFGLIVSILLIGKIV
jgi:V/A-type H+-transporting ATPase subunit K